MKLSDNHSSTWIYVLLYTKVLNVAFIDKKCGNLLQSLKLPKRERELEEREELGKRESQGQQVDISS